MSQIIVGPNDVYIVETAEIREMAEKNKNDRVVRMLDRTKSKFVKIIFDETEMGFIDPRHEFLDKDKEIIPDAKMYIHPEDYLSFIGKFKNVELIKGQPNNGEKLRTRRSAVKTEYDVFHDGDVYHVPYSDFISLMKDIAHEDYLDKYERMAEYGIEHILFSFHYSDGRETAGNKLHGFGDDEKPARVNPYYQMEFEIWATDAQGRYFYEGVDKITDESKRDFEIVNNLKTMKRDYIQAIDNTKISFCHSRMGYYNIERFFNNYDLVRNLNRVGNISNDKRSFASVSEMIPIVNKMVGRKHTIQNGDRYHIPASGLNDEVKEKYGIDDTVNVLLVEVNANSVEPKYLDIETTFVSWGLSRKGPLLLARELDEIFSVCDKNKEQILFETNKSGNISSKREDENKSLSMNTPGVELEKHYLTNISVLESLNNKGLNNQLEKIKALGNHQVLVAIKQDIPYKLNGRTDILNHKFNKEIDFNPLDFPEMDIYAFNNQTGKAYDPTVLKNMTLDSIIKNQDGANDLLSEQSRDDLFPKNDRSLKSASIYTLGTHDIFTLLKEESPLKISNYRTGYFSEKTEFNLYMVSKIGQEWVKELNQDLKEGDNTFSRPKMR